MSRIYYFFHVMMFGLTCWPVHACAEQPNSALFSLSEAELEQRLTFIADRLTKQQPSARYWQYGWTGFYALSAAGQVIAAMNEDDNDDQINYGVGALKSSGALAQLLVRPLPAVQSADDFDSLPQRTRAERIRKLEHGEALMHEIADRAMERFTWKPHLIGIGANLVGGIVIAAFGDSDDAVTSTLIGIAVNQASIWTQPSRGVKDLQDYQDRNWHRGRADRGSWRLVPTLGGFALHAKF